MVINLRTCSRIFEWEDILLAEFVETDIDTKRGVVLHIY